MSLMSQSGTPFNITGTTTIVPAGTSCSIIGFYVNSTSSGTLVLGNGTTAISGTITPVIGYHAFPAQCTAGVVATIANTLNVTIFVRQGD